MSVRDELSSEVAVALLEMDGAVKARDLKEVLAMLRSTLSALSTQERERRRARLILARAPGLTLNATGGAN